MKKTLFTLALFSVSIAGCRAQSSCTVAAPCTTVPTAPSVGVALAWNASATGGVSYAVYRTLAGGTVSYVRIDTTNITGLSFIDSNVAPGTAYSYFVEAYTPLNGNFSTPSNVVTITTFSNVLTPANLTAVP